MKRHAALRSGSYKDDAKIPSGSGRFFYERARFLQVCVNQRYENEIYKNIFYASKRLISSWIYYICNELKLFFVYLSPKNQKI